MTKTLAVLLAVAALSACERNNQTPSSGDVAQPAVPTPTADKPTPPPPPVHADAGPADPFVLRGQLDAIRGVDRQLASAEIAWIAEVSHGNKRAAIVWPALHGGRVIDNDVIAIVFENQGGSWKISGREIGPKPELDRLESALGGKLTFAKPDGLPLDEITGHILGASIRFKTALKAGNSADAIAAFEDYARAFGPGMLIYENHAVNMIIEGRLASVTKLELRDMNQSGDTATGVLVSTEGGEQTRVPVQLVRAGTGWAIDGFGN